MECKCPTVSKQEKLRYHHENEKCKKLFTNYKKQTIRNYTKCNQRAYSPIEKINKRTEKCMRKHCKRQVQSIRNKVRRLFHQI